MRFDRGSVGSLSHDMKARILRLVARRPMVRYARATVATETRAQPTSLGETSEIVHARVAPMRRDRFFPTTEQKIPGSGLGRRRPDGRVCERRRKGGTNTFHTEQPDGRPILLLDLRRPLAQAPASRGKIPLPGGVRFRFLVRANHAGILKRHARSRTSENRLALRQKAVRKSLAFRLQSRAMPKRAL